MLHFYKQPIREEKVDLPLDINLVTSNGNVMKKRKLDTENENVENDQSMFARESYNNRVITDNLPLNSENLILNKSSETEQFDILDDLSDFDLSVIDSNIEKNSVKSMLMKKNCNEQLQFEPIMHVKIADENQENVQQLTVQSKLSVGSVTAPDSVRDNFTPNVSRYENTENVDHTTFDRDNAVMMNKYTDDEKNNCEYFVQPGLSVDKEILEDSNPDDFISDLFESQSIKSTKVCCEISKDTNFSGSLNEKLENSVILFDNNNVSASSLLNVNSELLKDELDMNFDVGDHEEESRNTKSICTNSSVNGNVNQASLSQWSRGHVVVENELLKVSSE